MILDSPKVLVGIVWLLFAPFPICPDVPSPQAYTFPSFVTTIDNWFAVAISLMFCRTLTPVSSLTCTGTFEFCNSPVPNCPAVPCPQAQTVPSFFKAKVWFPLVAILTTLSISTFVGAILFLLSPSPN